MQVYIIVKLQVEGIHFWKNCPIKEVSFLKHPHRHEFYIEALKAVTHLDRDIEIIKLKREMTEFLLHKYALNGITCDFQGMSCEMIARELLVEFNLDTCKVLEDNENGAVVLI